MISQPHLKQWVAEGPNIDKKKKKKKKELAQDVV